MLLLDADVLVDVQRGHPPAVAWFAGPEELPAVPGLVIMELVQNAHDRRRVQKVLKLVAPLSVIWPNETDGQRALDLFAVYHLSNGLGLVDALIASCAIGRSATLCTFNFNHYQAIPGLALLRPYDR